MSNLTTRAGKGSPLTNNELDANFTNLNSDKVEIGGDLSGTSSAPNVAKIQGRAVSSDAPAAGEKLVWNGTAWEPSTDPSGEPIGHADKSQSSISFNSGNRTFSISPVSTSFDVWCKGVKYTYSTAQSVVIPNTTGLHFIYFSASGVLSTQMSYFTWEEHAPTAYVYWNSTTQQAIYFGDERHGITLDWQTHEYLHRTRGAAIANGFAASGYTTTGAGATDADAQIDIGGGTFFDEDMQVDIVSTNTPVAGTWQQDLSGPALIPVLYLSGSAWIIDAPTNFPFKVVSGVPQYNLFSGGSWSTAAVTNNEYFVSWILATNNLTYPVIAVISQAPTNQLSAAEAMTFEGLNLNGFPSVEFRPLYKVIYQHKNVFANSVKASTIAVYDLRSLQSAGVAAALVQDHGNLSGLGDDDHAQYLHVSEVRSPSSAVKNSFLPTQAGQSGKYLTTDGSNPSWGAIPSGSLSFTGDVTGSGTTGSSTTLTLSNSGVTAGTYSKVTVDAKGRVTTGALVSNTDVTTALGFTPENSGNKGVANGYASLDGSGKVPSTQLPSYVDDVLEYANLAALPGTGESGKIYITIDTAKTYRWSGSAYVEISASPGSTDAVPEGSTNLYFTNSRARGAITATGSLSYNNSTGVLSYTQPTNVSTFTNDSGYITDSASITGNAATATKLATGRTIAVTGDVTGTSVAFDGSANLSFATTLANSGVTAGTYGSSSAVPVVTVDAKGRVTGVSTSAISGSITFTGDVTGSGTTGSSTALTLANSGVTAGTYQSVTVDAKGRVTSGTSPGYLTGNQTITLSGDASGSGATGISVTLANSGVTAGTYTKVTVDAKGRVTVGTALASADLPTYTGAISSSQVTTALGYTPYNSTNPNGYLTDAMRYRGSVAQASVDTATLDGFYTQNNTGDSSGLLVFNAGGSLGPLQMRFTYGGTFEFRNKTDSSTWTSFKTVAHSGNFTNFALSSGQVTTALGFTPYNASNPNGYITSASLSGYLPLTGGTLTGSATISGNGNGLYFTGGNNRIYFGGSYRAMEGNGNGSQLQIGEGYSATYLQSANNYATTSNHLILHAGNYNSYALPLSGGTVTGGTTFNSTVYFGTDIQLTRSDVSPALLFTSQNQWRWIYNGGGNYWQTNLSIVSGGNNIAINGNAALHAGNYTGYNGILRALGGADGMDFNTSNYNSMYYAYIENSANKPTSYSYPYGTILTFDPGVGSAGRAQFYISHAGNDLTFRGGWGGNSSWQTWNRVLTNQNYTSYSPSLTGSGASGTWGINISGNSATATKTTANSGYTRVGYGMAPFYNWGGTNAGSGAPSDSTYTTGIDVGSHPSDQAYGFQIASNMWNVGLWTRTYNSGFSNWVRILDTNNYSSYSPTLTGGNASGTWSINVTGSAGSAPANGGTATALNGSNYISRTGTSGNANTDFNNTPAGSVRHHGDDSNVTNSPGGTWWFYNHYRHSNSSNYWGTQVAWGWEDNANSLAQRNVTGGNWSGWVRYLNSSNYNSYSPTLTGGGASGTWGINITGNAATVGSRSPGGGAGNLAHYDSSNSYLYAPTWIGIGSGSGIFSTSGTNGAHWHPTGAAFGVWNISGSKGGYSGISCNGTNHYLNWMVDMGGNLQGWYNQSYGWQMFWSGGSLYCFKNSYGGGTQATVLDSSNYASYAGGLSSGNNWTAYNYFVANRNTTSDSPPLQAFSNNGSGAIMSFHRGGYYAVNFGLDSDNVMRIGGWSAAANRWQLDMSGNGTYAGNVTAYSDERLKKDWSPISVGFVDRLAEMLAGTYTRIDSGERQAGVSAQKMREILPEVVSEDNEGTLALAYGNAAMVSAVELAKELVMLKKELAELKSRLH